MNKVIYPGSFDPITNGHLDIIERSAKIFEKVVVAVAVNLDKNPLFPMEEKKKLIKESTKHLKNIEVDSFTGLLIDYLKKTKTNLIVKGLRAVTDFEIEFQMALINKKLNPKVETFFLVTKAENAFLSSSVVKEVASFGGDVSAFVPECVNKKLKEKFILIERRD